MPYEPIDFSRRSIAEVPKRLKKLMQGDTVNLPGGLCQEGGRDYFTLSQQNSQVCLFLTPISLELFMIQLSHTICILSV